MTLRVKDILQSEGDGREIVVEGWVRSKRDSKNVCFLAVSDGSALQTIQIVFGKDDGNVPQEVLDKAANGAAVRATGSLVASQGKNQSVEVQGTNLEVVGECPQDDYPLQKKRHSFEFLREIAHLRPRTNTIGAVARVRSAMSFAIHRFFKERGFVYVHTPILTGSDAEGAGQMFQVTTHDVGNPPRDEEGQVDYAKDFFAKQAHLAVSGQLEAENFAMALRDVYTFGPTFRAENSNTSRHLAEFWMMEPEMAFCELEQNMDVAEEFLKDLIGSTLRECADDMAFFNQWIDKGIIETLEHVVESDFVRLTYTDAIKELETSGQKFEYPVKWGIDMQSEHERYLTETTFKKPVIVTDYPKDIKAFYMKLNDDEKTVRAMDVLVPRIGEIIGGSERESRYDVLLKRIREMDLPEEHYWWYLDLRKYGTAPHSGFGLGFERAIQYVTGMANIRDVIPFPRASGLLEF